MAGVFILLPRNLQEKLLLIIEEIDIGHKSTLLITDLFMVVGYMQSSMSVLPGNQESCNHIMYG